MKKPLKIILIIFLFFLFYNCERRTEKYYLRELINERLGDSIIFPSSIYMPISDSDSIRYEKFRNYEYTMIVYTDGDCGKCISDLYQWSQFLKENSKTFASINQKFVIYSANFIRFEYTTEKAGLSLPYYYDSLNNYTSINKVDDPVLYTLLLDRENRIKLIGSPLRNPAMLELYQKVLSESINDED